MVCRSATWVMIVLATQLAQGGEPGTRAGNRTANLTAEFTQQVSQEDEPAPPAADDGLEPVPHGDPDPDAPGLDTNSTLLDAIFAPQSEMPAKRMVPPPIDYSYDRISEEAYDLIGGFNGEGVQPPGRPEYPYGAREWWYGHDAGVEEWGDLLEAPYVQLGWFANVDVSLFKAKMHSRFNSGSLLDGVFPGSPVILGGASLDWNVMPRVEVGYRFEHGLGELRAGYQHLDARGSEAFAPFDTAGNGTLHSALDIDIIDLDLCIMEFNSESLPLIPPLIKNLGRMGLGRPLTYNRLLPPLEIRWTWGVRGAMFKYETQGAGDIQRERVMNQFNGAGLHFALELNQRLRVNRPLFVHFRAEGSGIFGYVTQEFERTTVLPAPATAKAAISHDSIGVPTVNLEFGLSYVPCWPVRNVRVTAAYQYNEWFSVGQTGASNADLLMHGMLFRGEYKF